MSTQVYFHTPSCIVYSAGRVLKMAKKNMSSMISKIKQSKSLLTQEDILFLAFATALEGKLIEDDVLSPLRFVQKCKVVINYHVNVEFDDHGIAWQLVPYMADVLFAGSQFAKDITKIVTK